MLYVLVVAESGVCLLGLEAGLEKNIGAHIGRTHID